MAGVARRGDLHALVVGVVEAVFIVVDSHVVVFLISAAGEQGVLEALLGIVGRRLREERSDVDDGRRR